MLGVTSRAGCFTDVITQLIKLARVDKPIGTLLLLWPCLIAIFAASKNVPDFNILSIFVVGTFIMRSAGCIINDIADIKFDKHVSRTKDRPLTSGMLNIIHAWLLFLFLLVVALFLVTFLKRGTILLAIGALFLAILYPWMKRWTYYPQMILSLAFSWSIPMVYYEVMGKVNLSAFLLWSSVICWVIAYDTIYAMVDRKDDLKIGIKSTAIAFGKLDVKIINILYILFFILFTLFGATSNFSMEFYIGVLIAAIYWLRYIFPKYSSKIEGACFTAFLKNNQMGLILFGFLALSTTGKVSIS